MLLRPWIRWLAKANFTSASRIARTVPRRRSTLTIERLEDRTVPAAGASFLDATLIDPAAPVDVPSDSIVGNESHYWKVELTTAGRLTTAVQATGAGGNLDSVLTLFGPNLELLLTSDDRALDDANPSIQQHLLPGTYFLEVAAAPASSTSGGYELRTAFVAAAPPLEDKLVANEAFAEVVADFNGDGHHDLAVVNRGGVSLLLGNGDGTFIPQQILTVSNSPKTLVLADFNGDGHDDLATASTRTRDVSVLLGNGNGTFAPERRLAVGDWFSNRDLPRALLAADINGDGHDDLIVDNYSGSTVSVCLSNGDGSFATEQRLDVGRGGSVGDQPLGRAMQVANLDGDDLADLVVANSQSHDVSVLLGNGDGTFAPQQRSAVGFAPNVLLIADLNGDGRPDLATANYFGNDVSVLLADGAGGFAPDIRFGVGQRALGLVATDFNGDRLLDLATANRGSGDMSVLLNDGDGGFAPEQRLDMDAFPVALLGADFNGDGVFDLATANRYSADVSVLVSMGDGTFAPQQRFHVGFGPVALLAADFSGDGIADVTTANRRGTVSVLLGNGDGSFAVEQRSTVGSVPVAQRVEDFNGDGRPDLAVANRYLAEVSVLLGNGSGTFVPERQVAVGEQPTGLLVADFNGDGRRDLVTANFISGDVSVLLGNGDGTFAPDQRSTVGRGPVSPVMADFDGDGHADLATANEHSDDVSVLHGNSDGTFDPERRFAVGDRPNLLLAADFNGDGFADLATANRYSADVSVLVSQPDGTFAPEHRLAIGGATVLLAADFDGDGHTDLASATNAFAGFVSVLLGNGDGTFAPTGQLPVGFGPRALLVADFNGDGFADLATANRYSDDVSVLLGNGDGTFKPEQRFGVGDYPNVLTATDLNGDGVTDLATDYGKSNRLSLLLGNGDGTFELQQPFILGSSLRDSRSAPLLVADFNGDDRADLSSANSGSDDVIVLLGDGTGNFEDSQVNPFGAPDSTPVLANIDGNITLDTLLVDGSGRIVLRQGSATRPGQFSAPTILNALEPALDAVVVHGLTSQSFIAAVDKKFDLVSLYRVMGNGTAAPLNLPFGAAEFTHLSRPVRLATADFNGDGRGDLAVVNAGNATVTVYRGLDSGHFEFLAALAIGAGQSEIELGDVDGIHGIDILVSSGTSGDVSIFLNDGTGNFATAGRFRAGFGLEGLEQASPGGVFVQSLAETSGLAVGDYFEDGILDVVVMNANYHSFTALAGTGNGTLVNATKDSLRTLTNAASTLIRSGQFDSTNTHLDVAVLNPDEQTIAIYRGDGHGNFAEVDQDANQAGVNRLAAGNGPSGFSVAQVNDDNRDGLIDVRDRLDLLVGNEDGDLLILFGQGDGTFVAPRPTGRSIPLVVADLDGNGEDDFVYANESLDQVSVAFNDPTQTTAVQGPRNGLLAPDAVLLTDLNDDGIDDLAVANSGSNNVFVYLGNGSGQFGQGPNSIYSFNVATAPAALTAAGDLNGDGLTDLLVAHRGSNVVKLLLSDTPGTDFNMTNNLTFTTSGLGPTSMLLKDVMKADGSAGTDGFDDLLVTNSQAAPGSRNGSIDVFASNGAGGFFDSSPNSTTLVGGLPIDIVDLGDRLATVNFGSNSLSILSSFNGTTFQRAEIATFGSGPSSAVSGVDEAGNDFLIVGSSDGILELFLDDGGELLTQGIIDSDLNPSAMALSVIQGSRAFYVTSDGVEQAFAFSLDDFAKPSDETLADLPSDSVAIIAALVAGSSDVSAADYFGGADGETVNFGELLFFSENGGAPTGAGGGDSASEVLEQLRHVAQRFVQGWAVTLGTGEGTGWQIIVSAVRSVLDTVGAVEVAGFNPFAGWQTVVVHLQVPNIGEALVSSIVNAGQATLTAGPVAAGVPSEAALRDFVFGSSQTVPFDGFESLAVTDEATVDSQNDEPLLPEKAMSRWWALPVERQAEELLLAGLLAATLWKPEPTRERRVGGSQSAG